MSYTSNIFFPTCRFLSTLSFHAFHCFWDFFQPSLSQLSLSPSHHTSNYLSSRHLSYLSPNHLSPNYLSPSHRHLPYLSPPPRRVSQEIMTPKNFRRPVNNGHKGISCHTVPWSWKILKNIPHFFSVCFSFVPFFLSFSPVNYSFSLVLQTLDHFLQILVFFLLVKSLSCLFFLPLPSFIVSSPLSLHSRVVEDSDLYKSV